ncbi:MAG: hypothetical protein HQ591_06965 [candidate division Zixibacteria bacterium]|nr:hypothetical protein [Candidatus Tariuqbacter arcticus]
MSTNIDEIVKQVKAFSAAEKESLYSRLLEDPEIREDLLDYLLVLQAEAEGGEPVALDKFLSGQRTYAAK